MAELPTNGKKRSNSDHRRLYRRSAAKDRRDKESMLLEELKNAMPLAVESTGSNIDRMSLIRLAVNLARLRNCVPKLMGNFVSASDEAKLWSEDLVSDCLDGYILICGSDGVVLYTTESVFYYLGLTQTDLVGHMLQEFVNQSDYDDLCRAADDQEAMKSYGTPIVMRMKSVVGPRGRKLHMKSPLMKPIPFMLRTLNDSDVKRRIYLLQASTSRTGLGNFYDEITNRYSPTAFVTRHTCDMKFTYIDERLFDYLNLEPKMLMGTSFYDLVHPEDLKELVKSLKELFKKTNCRTPYFRMICADGAAIWVQTEAGIVSFNSRGHRSQNIICLHQVIGRQSDIKTAAFDGAKDSFMESDSDVFEPSMDSGSSFDGQRTQSFDDVLKWLLRDNPDCLSNDYDMSDIQSTATKTQSPLLQKQQCGEDYKDFVASVDNSTALSPPSEKLAACQLQEYCNSNKDTNIFTQQAANNDLPTITETPYDCDSLDNYTNTIHPLSDLSSPMDKISSEDVPQMLETLAPFLAQEEMLPLDIQGLISDFNIDDWFPSDIGMNMDADQLLMTPQTLTSFPSQSDNMNTIPNTQLELQGGDLEQLWQGLSDELIGNHDQQPIAHSIGYINKEDPCWAPQRITTASHSGASFNSARTEPAPSYHCI